jgi:PKD repeat protein
VAAFSLDDHGGRAPHTVAVDDGGSTDPDGTIVGYHWDFGDGTTASGPTARHTFTSPGRWIVSLTVTDDQGASHVAVDAVRVYPEWTGRIFL